MAPSALAIRRITIDTKKAMELGDSGIYWISDETDITRGWAVVTGLVDTPYFGGAYCFEVHFPDNYPFEPPSFVYLTNDGRTRFNPNLYKNGKVCLSLLNTWQGEQWSGVQSLSSVLQCIQSAVLIGEPLRNEPTYSSLSLHTDIPVYSRLILHANFETAVLGQLENPPNYLVPVYDAFRQQVVRNREALLKVLREAAILWDGKMETNEFFHMSAKYRFGALADRLEKALGSATA